MVMFAESGIGPTVVTAGARRYPAPVQKECTDRISHHLDREHA
jgi:hypothetical protein